MKNPNIKPMVVGTTQACILLGCGKTRLFENILPELDSYLEGSKRMITVESIEKLIERRLAQKVAA
jgi:hypothetical protein